MLTAIKNLITSVSPAVLAVAVLAVVAVLVWLWRRRSAAKVQTAPPMPRPLDGEYEKMNQMALADANAAVYASTVRDGLDQEHTVAPIMIPVAPGDIQPSDVVPDDIYDREDDGAGGDDEYVGAGEYDDEDEYEPME